VAVAYTAERGWHALPAPPSWWIDERAAELASDLPATVTPAGDVVEARRERARRAAAARWAGLDRAGRREATAAARTAYRGLPDELRRATARRAGVASGAARRAG
jgi:hypothetical protein